MHGAAQSSLCNWGEPHTGVGLDVKLICTVPSTVAEVFFTESPSAYRRHYPNTLMGHVFYGASSKILAVTVHHLLILDAQVGELTSFFNTRKVAGKLKLYFVSDVWKHDVERGGRIPSVDHLL